MSKRTMTLEDEVLDYLRERGGTSCTGIADSLKISAYEVYRALLTLERKGLAKPWFPPLWGATFQDEAEAYNVGMD